MAKRPVAKYDPNAPLDPNATPLEALNYWNQKIDYIKNTKAGSSQMKERAKQDQLQKAETLRDEAAAQWASDPSNPANPNATSGTTVEPNWAKPPVATKPATTKTTGTTDSGSAVDFSNKQIKSVVNVDAPATTKATDVPPGTTPPSTGQTPPTANVSDTSAGVLTPISQAALQAQGTQGPLTPEEAQDKFVKQYGPIASMAVTIPWMNDILQQAINGNWTSTKFIDAIQSFNGGKNWQSIGQSVRDSQEAYFGNKQAWAQQYNDKLDILKKSAIAQGLDPSAFGNALNLNDVNSIDAAFKDSGSAMNTFFNQYYNNIPDQATLDKYVANHSTIAKQANNALSGTLATTAASLKNYASQYGVASQYLGPNWSNANGTVSDSTDYFTNAASAIAKGLTSADSEQALYRQQAMNIYKPFAQQIANGYSVAQLAQPYTSTVQNLLEIPGQPIDLGSSTGYGAMVTKALQGDGTNPMSLDQFTTQVKQRPEWLQTGNARNSLMDTANQLLHSFGLVVD